MINDSIASSMKFTLESGNMQNWSLRHCLFILPFFMRSMHMLSLTTARAFNIPFFIIFCIAPRLQTNSNFTFRKNQICAGHAAGIAITEDGRGHISYNEISNMEWAGIDVPYGGNPVISIIKLLKDIQMV